MTSISEALDKWGNETVSIIKSNLSSTGTNATSDTSKSLQSIVRGGKLEVSGREFIYTVETGRKAGKRPPISNILKWVNSGKVSFEGNAKSLSYAISNKIAKEGSKLFREGGRKDIITPAISNDRIDDLMQDIADITQNKYADEIESTAKR